MPRHARKLNQIGQLSRKPTGRLMPQVVKAQINQKVFLRRYLRRPQSLSILAWLALGLAQRPS